MKNAGEKVNVLLLNVPEDLYDVSNYTSILQNFGLAMISSVLKKHGHNVTLLDAAANGLNRNRIREYFRQLNPKILGITAMTHSLNQIIDLLRDAKKFNPDVITVLGGPHPTSEYKNLLDNFPEVDISAIGEGEYTMLEIVEKVQSKGTLECIKGIAFRSNGTIQVNPLREPIEDLDSLPLADWDSLPMQKYFDRWTVKKNYALINASRGCAYSCTFCVHNFIGKRFRRRSPEIIIEEIKLLYNKYDVRHIEFSDSTLNSDNEWLKEICKGFINLKKPIFWGCEFRPDKADLETLKLMKKSGCIHLCIGVESADNGMLKRMKKGETIEKIGTGIRMAQEVGLNPDLGFILGMPGETKETVMKTINFAREYPKSSVTFTFATPYSGSQLYEIAKKEGQIVDDWSKHSMHRLVYVPNTFTKEELQNYYKLAIRSVFLRPIFIYNQILNIKSWLHFKIALRFASRVFFKKLRWLNTSRG